MIAEIGLGEAIVTGAAFVGAALGVINLFLSLDQRRIKLRLSAGHAFPTPNMPPEYQTINAYISVTNLSTFPVFISRVGIVRARWINPNWRKKRNQIADPIVDSNKQFPIELKPRESDSFWLRLYETKPDYRAAYAETACGKIVRASTQGFRQIIRKELSSH